MKKRYKVVTAAIMAICMSACSAGTEGEADAGGASRTEGTGEAGTDPGGQAGAASGEQPREDSTEISQGDPVLGIVDRYADGVIVIRDADDEGLVYYFSTQDAQIIEGDSPISAGELVEITYRGVMGDEEHPGTAVKVVSESMIYKPKEG